MSRTRNVMHSREIASPQRAVLVTGASTGIGRKITERLAADGHFVYAGARKDSHLCSLGAMRNVQPLRLDVTNLQDIASAAATVLKAGRGLYGLVNNAGVGTLGPIINGSDEEFDLVMAVNVYGPYRITKAFSRMIVAERGRIVTIGSISGVLAGANAGAYSMSKHAIEAFTDSLAEELEALGVHVSIVEPGRFNTGIVNAAVERTGADPGVLDLSSCRQPNEVADAVADALFETKPRRRYLVVSDEGEARKTIKKQISRLVQLNEGHSSTYDRDALIEMLDEEFVKSRPRTSQASHMGAASRPD